MKRTVVLLVWITGMVPLAGCSTAPVADLMDYFSPGRLGSETTPPYGGVAAPYPGGQSVPPGAVVSPGLPPLPPAPPATSAPPADLTGPIASPPGTIPPADSFGPPR